MKRTKATSRKSLILSTVLFLLLLLSVGATIKSLQSNNLRMIELRQAVFDADESGVGINEALNRLRIHVHSHMNSSLSSSSYGISSEQPLQLQKSFERDMAIYNAEQINYSASLDKVRKDAEVICQARGGWLTGIADCVAKYISDSGVPKPTTSRPIKENYVYNFYSPAWTPDKAGWLVLLSSTLMIINSIIWVRYLLIKLILSIRSRH